VLETSGGELIVGTVGQLTARKGVIDLLQAIAMLKEKGVRVRCLVLGEGPQRAELEAEAARRGVVDEIDFLGFQIQPLAWVQAMDVVVLCSSREGLPRVVLEAMLAGKPVVGSDVTGTRELVVNEETGLLYPYGDVDALAAALRRLEGDPATRARMGNAGRERVCERFSIESYNAGVSAVLTEVLAGSHRAGSGQEKGK
jgi:glycosyltransferase involved in cell wall biosynthesis